MTRNCVDRSFEVLATQVDACISDLARAGERYEGSAGLPLPSCFDDIRDRSVAYFCSPPSHLLTVPILKFCVLCVRPIGRKRHLKEGKRKLTHVAVTTSGDVRDQPKVADAASELLQEIFGKEKNPCRLVYGVASLPRGTPGELEVIFEV